MRCWCMGWMVGGGDVADDECVSLQYPSTKLVMWNKKVIIEGLH